MPLSRNRFATALASVSSSANVRSPAAVRSARRSGIAAARWASQVSRKASRHPAIIPHVPIRHRDAPPEESLYAPIEWEAAHEYGDLLYEKGDGIAKISINRPDVRNAFRPQTLAELRDAFNRARDDTDVGSIIFTGAGTEAFCSGGDQRIRGDDGYIGDDEVAQKGVGRLDVGDLHVQIRRLPKPVVAMVAGYAVGGGHILHLVCDLTIAGDNAALRADRAAGRLVRRRLRRVAPRQQHRRQEGEGDLVPLPPLRGGRGARDGPRQHGSPGS